MHLLSKWEHYEHKRLLKLHTRHHTASNHGNYWMTDPYKLFPYQYYCHIVNMFIMVSNIMSQCIISPCTEVVVQSKQSALVTTNIWIIWAWISYNYALSYLQPHITYINSIHTIASVHDFTTACMFIKMETLWTKLKLKMTY